MWAAALSRSSELPWWVSPLQQGDWKTLRQYIRKNMLGVVLIVYLVLSADPGHVVYTINNIEHG